MFLHLICHHLQQTGSRCAKSEVVLILQKMTRNDVESGRKLQFHAILKTLCCNYEAFYPVAPKPLRIVTKTFVTFPEYMWAKNAQKISDISPSISNMVAGKWTPN